jgi:ferredoxin-NADP reductase
MPLPPSGATGRLTLENRRFLTTDTVEIGFGRPAYFEFRAGQRIQLLHGNLRRDYSIISDPADSRLSFCIRLIKGGKLSILLSIMPIGTAVSFFGPQGYFIFRPSFRPAVFVATGTGIAPFVSMARSGISGFTLLHGIREISEAYFSTLFRSVARPYIPCISGQPLNDLLPTGAFQGRVTHYLDHHLPKGSYDFYLSGQGGMIRDAMHIIDRRFPDSLVFTEIFY